jgi:hypothetical protein
MHGMTELQEIEIESEGRKGSRVFWNSSDSPCNFPVWLNYSHKQGY